MIRSERMKKTAVALFFALLLLVGLCTVRDYTGSYDEIAEQMIVRSNLKEYAQYLQRVGIRLDYWLECSSKPISESIERDHGAAGFYLYGLLFPLIEHQETVRYTLWGVMIWLWFMLGVWSLYAIARRFGMNRILSCAASLLLYLCPVFFAQGHINNKDIVLLCLTLATLWQGMRFLEDMSVSSALCFSFMGALAMNTKIAGAMAWGVMGFCALVKTALEKKWDRKQLTALLTAVISFPLIYMLLTPAMWASPIAFIRYLLTNAAAFSRFEGQVIFRDALFTIPKNQLPVYYLPYMIMVTLPVYVLLLCAAGQIAALWQGLKSPAAFLKTTQGCTLAAATMCWMAPVAGFVLIRPTVYHSWRHFYFVFGGMAVLAVYGVKVFWQMTRRCVWLKRIAAAVLAVCFAASAIGIAVNHPRQSVYYNVLASGHEMEAEFWNTSGAYALRRLAECEERDQALPMEVGCWFYDIGNARFKLEDELKAQIVTTTVADAPYLYYPEKNMQTGEITAPEGYRVLFEVEGYGRKIGTMYERKP